MLPYLSQYPIEHQQQVAQLLADNKVGQLLKRKYPAVHEMPSHAALYEFTQQIKNEFMKKSPPLSKAIYDGKIHVINNALGTHRFTSKNHGGKLKAKNEIRISSLFQKVPEDFLRMIVVHELAHFKEKEHNKAFYQLCCHMMPDYHQVEFDVRVYLTELEANGEVY